MPSAGRGGLPWSSALPRCGPSRRAVQPERRPSGGRRRPRSASPGPTRRRTRRGGRAGSTTPQAFRARPRRPGRSRRPSWPRGQSSKTPRLPRSSPTGQSGHRLDTRAPGAARPEERLFRRDRRGGPGQLPQHRHRARPRREASSFEDAMWRRGSRRRCLSGLALNNRLSTTSSCTAGSTSVPDPPPVSWCVILLPLGMAPQIALLPARFHQGEYA